MRSLILGVLFPLCISSILVGQVEICPLLLFTVERTELTKKLTENPEAYTAYLKGWRNFWDQPDQGWRQAVQYFKKAIELDPDFAMAYVGLSWSYDELCRQKNEYCAEYRETVKRTVEIDNILPQVLTLKGYLLAFTERNWAAAKAEFKRVKELDPHFPSVVYGVYLLWMGQPKEAVAELDRWVQQTDPLSAGEQCEAIYLYYITRSYDRALEKIKRVKLLDPDRRVAWYEWLCYQGKGPEKDTFKAFLSMRKKHDSVELLQKYTQVFRESGMQGVYRLRLGDFAGKNSHKPFDVAGMYALAGEKDFAFELLEKAYESPLPSLFVNDARFNSLRGDPRYEQLLHKLNLPEEAIERHLAPQSN